MDDHLVAGKVNVTRTYHAFEKYAGSPATVADGAWEGTTAYVSGTAVPRNQVLGPTRFYPIRLGP